MTSADKKRRFAQTVAHLQRRYGLKVIRPLKQQMAELPDVIPTGFPTLDDALVIGGIPYGRITEIVAVPTSGMTTLALKIIIEAQRRGETVVYLDAPHTFDPDYAHQRGLQLPQLMLVHPYNVQEAIAMLPDFAVNGGFRLLVCDLPLYLYVDTRQQDRLSSALGRLLAPLHKGDCALLFLTSLASESGTDPLAYPSQAALPHYATLRLLVRRQRWLHRRQDIRGYETEVLVLKNKLGPAGRKVTIPIPVNQSDQAGDR